MQEVPPTLIDGLEQLIREAAARPDAPVDRWNPPYCGDIGLAILSDATWTYRGSPITRMPLVKLFARVLRREEDGRTFLVTPGEKIDIAVADAPFLAVEMENRGQGREQQLVFRTNVDDVVIAGPDHPLTFKQAEGGGLKPYVRVRGRLDALVSRSLTYDLLEGLQPGPANPQVLGIWSSGVFVEVPQG